MLLCTLLKLILGTVVAWSVNSLTNQVAAQGPAVRPAAAPLAANNKAASAKPKQKIREGSRLEEIPGRFDFAGERMAFYPAGGTESFRVLENLSAERIWQTSQDSNRPQEWVVSGIATEFRGANYLLVTKAIIRAETSESKLGTP